MEDEVLSSDGGGNTACCCRSDGISKFREHILENVEAAGVGFCFIILFFFYRVETYVERERTYVEAVVLGPGFLDRHAMRG